MELPNVSEMNLVSDKYSAIDYSGEVDFDASDATLLVPHRHVYCWGSGGSKPLEVGLDVLRTRT
jgi:hypothetical protein